MNPIELLKFVQTNVEGQGQLEALAALADAPPEDYVQKVRLPVQNEIPSFRLGDGGLGSILAGTNYGVPAPVIGSEPTHDTTIGQLLVGDING